jgi:hypothetical protein
MIFNFLMRNEEKKKITCPERGSNSRPPDYETDALPTALSRQL